MLAVASLHASHPVLASPPSLEAFAAPSWLGPHAQVSCHRLVPAGSKAMVAHRHAH